MVFCRDILTLMNTPADCFEEAYSYIVVIFAGIPFIFLYNLLSGYLRSLGDSRTPLLFLVLSSLMNVVLDLAFILLFDMGITGAALATVVSQTVSGLLCLLFIMRRVPILHISKEEWRFRTDRAATLCTYGVPMGLQYSITAIGTVVLQVAVNSLGSLAVAAMTAACKVLGFLACPFDALGSTMATYTAQNVGASRYERLNRGVFTASAMGFVYSVFALAVAWFFGRNLTQLFVSGESAELIRLARQYMLTEIVFYPLLTLVNVVRFSIQGMGFSVFAVIAGVLEMVARSLAGMMLVPVIAFQGVALGGPLAWLFADAFLVPAYFRCKKQLIARMHHLHARG